MIIRQFNNKAVDRLYYHTFNMSEKLIDGTFKITIKCRNSEIPFVSNHTKDIYSLDRYQRSESPFILTFHKE